MQKKLTIPLLLSCILGLTACGGSGGTNNGDTGKNNNRSLS